MLVMWLSCTSAPLMMDISNFWCMYELKQNFPLVAPALDTTTSTCTGSPTTFLTKCSHMLLACRNLITTLHSDAGMHAAIFASSFFLFASSFRISLGSHGANSSCSHDGLTSPSFVVPLIRSVAHACKVRKSVRRWVRQHLGAACAN